MKFKKLILKNYYTYLLVIVIIFLFFVSSVIPSSNVNISNMVFSQNSDRSSYGYILYTPEYSTNSYLLDNNGEIVNSWRSKYIQGLAVHLLENGDILRSDLPYTNPKFWGGGVSGCVERFNWGGSLVWDFKYSNEQHCLHHDIEPLPNGNILMIAWDYKTVEEAIEAGRNPVLIGLNYFWPDYIIEVEPTGSSGGNIVWEWHVWDHLIQDFDPTKENYGVVADHPELIDINFPQIMSFGDWSHMNSIDYNEEFDQILFSLRLNSEIFVIDHSTTTEEAKGHSGGKYGKGGDILYRWGNPRAYHTGTVDDQKFFDQHDARWVESNYPGEGNIMVFSNGKSRPGLKYSSVDEIKPPVDSDGFYYLEPGLPYGPDNLTWSYTADNPVDFYSDHLSGAQRLYNGNTLICDGSAGKFFEVTPEKEVVWQYINPYPDLLSNDVFTIQHYPLEGSNEGADLDCQGSLNWIDIKVGDTLNGSFNLQNIGDNSSVLNWGIELQPNWGTWSFNPSSGKNLTPEDGQLVVQVSVVAPDKKDKEFVGYIRIQNLDNFSDFEDIPVYLKTSKDRSINSALLNLRNHLNQFPILKKILFTLD